MKVIIFAGGFGRRLWPISLSSSPKQFEPIIGDRSTIQLAVDRVLPQFGAENIFISTNQRYADIIRDQLPDVPPENVIGEPTRRDLAAAVGLAMAHLSKKGAANEPVGILWGDNYMKDVPVFQSVMGTAEKIIEQDKANMVFMGESPRFANANLGWINLGDQRGEIDGNAFFDFGKLTYRPPQDDCDKMFAGGNCVWNTGYFVTSIGYVQNAYKEHMPDMAAQLHEIASAIGTDSYQATLDRIYPTLESISFDDAILTHLDPAGAAVLHAPMGWSDPGTLYSLKEAINPSEEENVTRGLVIDEHSQDSLIYNYEEGKVVMGVGLEGMIVVNTPTAVLVVHKNDIKKVKALVEGFAGTELEKFS
ncbi:MAG: sugar phosphate nucleotidyltransferase [Chloroflexota bacterium]